MLNSIYHSTVVLLYYSSSSSKGKQSTFPEKQLLTTQIESDSISLKWTRFLIYSSSYALTSQDTRRKKRYIAIVGPKPSNTNFSVSIFF